MSVSVSVSVPFHVTTILVCCIKTITGHSSNHPAIHLWCQFKEEILLHPKNHRMSFKPPQKFDFTRPNEWPKWRQSYQRFHSCTEMKKKDGTVQVDSLLYAMGPEAETIVAQLALTADESKNFDAVITKLNDYFKPKTNVIHERARLNQRVQKEGETSQAFISSLYELAENCGYSAEVKKEQIRDRLVSGIKDKTLSKELQMKTELTLDQAVEMVCHSELVSTQISNQATNHLEEVKTKPKRYQQHRKPQQQKQQPVVQQQRQQQKEKSSCCMRCGRSHSRNYTCAATRSKCHHCGKMGHFAVVCRQLQQGKPSVAEIETNQPPPHDYVMSPTTQPSEENQQELFIGSVDSDKDEPFTTNIQINGQSCVFKIDTGADVCVMSESTYKNLHSPPPLKPTTTILRSYGGKPSVIGVFETGDQFKFPVYVVTGEGE